MGQSVDPSSGRATIGGLFRGADGRFIAGFAKFLGGTTISIAEAQALSIGSRIAVIMGMKKVILEGDSTLVIYSVIGRRSIPWRIRSVISETKERLNEADIQ